LRESFPRLEGTSTDLGGLPRRVLCIAPHPDDEVLGCGGALALHARRGDAIRVLVLTDGSRGVSRASASGVIGSSPAPLPSPALAEIRAEESRRAGRVLGVHDVRFAGFADGELGAETALVETLRRELEEFRPELVYAPSPFELHPDHRAASHACSAALARGPRRRVLLYGVNTPVPASFLLDVTPSREIKRSALACFESQLDGVDLLAKVQACDLARTINIEDPAVTAVEGFVDLASDELLGYRERWQSLQETAPRAATAGAPGELAATAVISTWNRVGDLRENLDALRAQTLPFESIVVVDNASRDETARVVAEHYPEVRLIVMPHSEFGACETFNVGFASVTTALTAILDDDVVLPPEWLEKTVARLRREPATTAIVSTEVVEPGMPASYLDSAAVRRERYMSTFRGCASLARSRALREAGFYDERLFLYGNERDLTCRLLNLGYRVLQYPEVRAFHKTPFGIKLGQRSLYYHARNAWLTMLKYAPARDLARLPWLVLTRVILRKSSSEAAGEVSDATGTIGIGRSLRETPGAWRVLLRAAWSVLCNVPYCLRHRRPCRSPDFELPLR
jgi:LmbE family N-acetylglucosaminyl deacetylase/GT2 family glycosyltransferase